MTKTQKMKTMTTVGVSALLRRRLLLRAGACCHPLRLRLRHHHLLRLAFPSHRIQVMKVVFFFLGH
jgi:hypothetical protein